MSERINKREYREIRVKVSDKIRDTIAKLIINEKDFEKKKKNPANWYREEVAKELKLKDKDNPSLRSYESIIQLIRKSCKVKYTLDKPWSIGSCIEYDIPADMIPVLIKIQQLRELITQKAQLGQITIRQARWFARLYPSVQRLTKKHYQDIVSAYLKLLWAALQEVPQYERKDQISKSVEIKKPEMSDFEAVELLLLVILGLHYANKERVSKLTGEDYPETLDLDNRYFIREDVSAVAFFDALQSVGLNAIIPEQHKRRGFSAKKLEAQFGKLTPSQVETLNEYLSAALSGFGGEWSDRHPEIAELMKTLEAKEHERLNNQEV